MIEIFQPFEVADSDSTGIAENIRQELDSLLQQNLLSLESSGAVGCLNDEFGLESVGVADVDGLLQGGWDEEITRLVDG